MNSARGVLDFLQFLNKRALCLPRPCQSHDLFIASALPRNQPISLSRVGEHHAYALCRVHVFSIHAVFWSSM